MSSAVDKTRTSRLRVPLIVGTILVLDQVTKSVMAARGSLPVSIIGTDVEFRVVRNAGGAFSTFTNATVVLALLAIGLTVWLVYTLRRTTDRLTVIALSLVLGGALGNLTDRLVRSPGFLRGHVVDFVHLGPWPSFNVADSAIDIGAVIFIIATFRASSSSKAIVESPEDVT